jgi:hypothetical protein
MLLIAIVAYRLNRDKSVGLRVCLLRGTRARLYNSRVEHLRQLQRAAAQRRIKLIVM